MTDIQTRPAPCHVCQQPAVSYGTTRAISGTLLRDLDRGDRPTDEAAWTVPYCPAHAPGTGSYEERMTALLHSQWDVAAPDSVGNHERVLRAGLAGLQSPHAYVVIRGPDSYRHWFAWRGLGSLQKPVYPAGVEAARRKILANYKGSRRNARAHARAAAPAWFPSRATALVRAVTVWREGVEARIDAIRRMRGGTLEWGCPVEPRREPHVILLPAMGGDAWTAPRLTPAQVLACSDDLDIEGSSG